MKYLINLVAFLLFTVFTFSNYSFNSIAEKPSKVEIKVSSKCGMCKTKLEHDLSFVKGIVEVKLDLPTKTLTVYYKSSKINVEQIRTAINNLGYDADNTTANAAAHDKLPACCQKNSIEH